MKQLWHFKKGAVKQKSLCYKFLLFIYLLSAMQVKMTNKQEKENAINTEQKKVLKKLSWMKKQEKMIYCKFPCIK